METKKAAITAASMIDTANVHNPTDLTKVLDYFRYTVGTTLDCMFDTGVLRNSVTWYVRYLERIGLLKTIYIGRDRRTHYLAKHYSADPIKWESSQKDIQLSLFNTIWHDERIQYLSRNRRRTSESRSIGGIRVGANRNADN